MNIFSWDGIGNLGDYKDSYQNGQVVNSQLGKVFFSLNLPESITNKIKNLDYLKNKDVHFVGIVYTEYNNEYGVPNLNMHLDKLEDVILFDYQLDSNIDWPLIIEDTEFQLNDNSGILFIPGKLIHGRPDISFNNNDYLKMIFFEMRENAIS